MPNFDKISVALEREMVDHLKEVRELLIKLVQALFPELLAKTIEFYENKDGKIERVEHMFLKANEKSLLSLVIKDSQGNPAKVDGAPRWAVTDPTLGRLEVAEDGLSATLLANGPSGAFQVQATVDADLGEGVRELLGTLDVEVLSGEAVSVEIAAGAAEPQ